LITIDFNEIQFQASHQQSETLKRKTREVPAAEHDRLRNILQLVMSCLNQQTNADISTQLMMLYKLKMYYLVPVRSILAFLIYPFHWVQGII